MNNLTSVLNAKLSRVDSEEFTKQGGLLEMTAGNVQRIAAMTMPAFSIRLEYKNLSNADWIALREIFQDNHSNTFLYQAKVNDPRQELIGDNASVWVFKNWEFNIDARTQRYNGFIELITSVYFNYAEYLALDTQSSSYNYTTSVDVTFTDLLAYISPYSIKYNYTGNSLTSSIMRSSQKIKDRGGLRKTWVINWLTNEANFLELVKFYRKKGGVFKDFGILEKARENNETDLYVVDEFDYHESEYFLFSINRNLKATFSHDGFKYVRRIDGLYEIEAQIVEAR